MLQTRIPGAEEESPRMALLWMTTGGWLAQAVSVAASLGVADLLAGGRRRIPELAQATGTDPGALLRLMRALAAFRVFSEQEGEYFALAPVGECLRSDVPGSMRGWAVMLGQQWFFRPWLDLEYSVRSGRPAFNHVFGRGTFDFFGEDAAAAGIFHDAMSALSVIENEAVLESFDPGAARVLVDVAGGQGSLLAAFLHRYPALRGILFDLPAVIHGTEERLRARQLESRCRCAGGDFFEGVPAGGDVYFLKHILHDWDDDRAVRILENCRRAMPPGARIVVVEALLSPGDAPSFGKLLDLNMLVRTGGRERTGDEFGALLAAAGLKLLNVTPTRAPVCLVEGCAR